MANIVSKFQVPSFNGLGVMMFWRLVGKGSVNQWINEWMNHDGVCRTAPATPGLLTSTCMASTGIHLLSKEMQRHEKQAGCTFLSTPFPKKIFPATLGIVECASAHSVSHRTWLVNTNWQLVTAHSRKVYTAHYMQVCTAHCMQVYTAHWGKVYTTNCKV